MQCVQISDPWLMNEVLAIANEHPEVIDKPRGFPLPIYDCFDRVRASTASGSQEPAHRGPPELFLAKRNHAIACFECWALARGACRVHAGAQDQCAVAHALHDASRHGVAGHQQSGSALPDIYKISRPLAQEGETGSVSSLQH